MKTNEDRNAGAQEQQERIAALRESIRRAFPTGPYTGKVTPNDDQLEDPELDEDKVLHEGLKGRRWTEVPTHLLRELRGGFVLLTDEAFVAFLPAWLMYSLEDMRPESQVRDYVVFTFCDTMRQFRVLNPEQRRTVRSLLAEFAEHGTSPYVAKLAIQALALIDKGNY